MRRTANSLVLALVTVLVGCSATDVPTAPRSLAPVESASASATAAPQPSDTFDVEISVSCQGRDTWGVAAPLSQVVADVRGSVGGTEFDVWATCFSLARRATVLVEDVSSEDWQLSVSLQDADGTPDASTGTFSGIRIPAVSTWKEDWVVFGEKLTFGATVVIRRVH